MRVYLKAGRERRLENFHPWVFKDDLLRADEGIPAGEVVDIHGENGVFLGRGYANLGSSIPVRVLTRERRAIDLAFYRKAISRAIGRREGLVSGTNAMRLVSGEGDALPGLIADRFGDYLAVQFRNAGVERHRELITQALRHEAGVSSAFERSDTSERAKEGLAERVGPLWGEPPEAVEFEEDGLRFRFSPAKGQKTGFYLDQRDNRRLMASLVGEGSRLLDVYSYTGGFSLQAAKNGATSLAVDKDAAALATLEATARQNGLDRKIGVRLGDAIDVLDALVKEGRRFTHAVLDPPTLAKRKDEVPAAKRLFTIGAKNVLRMLEPGGVLMVTTCAFHLKLDDLVEAVRFAGADAERRLEVLNVTFQPPDHPWVLQIPESLYLKTLVLRAD
jgi:23S rRNA (cytosine1962-C5)-methyltransferase